MTKTMSSAAPCAYGRGGANRSTEKDISQNF
jgi:hypothetical protein